MLTAIVVALIMAGYLVTGVAYSRNRYAQVYAQRKTYIEGEGAMNDLTEMYKRTYVKNGSANDVMSLKHTPNCGAHRFTAIKEYRKQYCGCGAYKRHKQYHQLADRINQNIVDEPSVMWPIFTWLYLLLSENFIQFLKSGKVETSDMTLEQYTEYFNARALPWGETPVLDSKHQEIRDTWLDIERKAMVDCGFDKPVADLTPAELQILNGRMAFLHEKAVNA